MSAPGQAATKTPGWAKPGLEALLASPGATLNALGGIGLGGFQDIMSGFGAAPSFNLFAPYGGMTGPVGQFSQQAAQAGGPLAGQAVGNAAGFFPAAQGLSQGGFDASSTIGKNWGDFLGASFPFYNQAKSLVGMNPQDVMSIFGIGSQGGRTAASPFSGQVAGAALGQMGNMNVNGDIYNRAMDLMRPQVRAAFSDRGLGASGGAIKEESNQAQQLADTMAQQSAQNRIGLLGAGASGEQANASMTNALANWQLGLGQQGAGLYNSMVQGALGGTQVPGTVFNQFQQGSGQGIQNIMQGMQGLSGLNLAPMQALGAGLQTMSQLPSPLQALYGATRQPELQMIQALTGATPLSAGQSPMGLFGPK